MSVIGGGVGHKRKSGVMSGYEQGTSGLEGSTGDSGSTQEQLAFDVIMTDLHVRLNRYSGFYEKISMNPIGIVHPNEIEHTLRDVLLFLHERVSNRDFHVGIPSLESLLRRNIMDNSLLPYFDRTVYNAVVKRVLGMCMKIFQRMFNLNSARHCSQLLSVNRPQYDALSEAVKLAINMVPENIDEVPAGATSYEREELRNLYQLMKNFFSHMLDYEDYHYYERSTYAYDFVRMHVGDRREYAFLVDQLSSYLAQVRHPQLLFSDIEYIFVNIFGQFIETFPYSNQGDIRSHAFKDAANRFRVLGHFVVFGVYGFQFAEMAINNYSDFAGFFNCVSYADEFLRLRK